MTAQDARPHLLGLLPDGLHAVLAEAGVPATPDHARRVLAWRLSHGARDLESMPRPVPRSVRQAVARLFRDDALDVVERVADPGDGSVRYLFRSPDGALHEAVRIPLHKPGHFSVCLSSQVGCAMACAFCATGRIGLQRHLSAWEMVAAWSVVRDEAPGRVTGAVFMGQGEPFHNYDAVISAARILSDPCGGRISGKNITISTVGLVPQIRRFTCDGHKFRLIVSLTSAVPERRAMLLPVAGRTPLAELAEALRDYHLASRQRVTIAWVTLGGVNTGADEVEALRALLGDVPLRINLIDVNDARDGDIAFRRATDAERGALLDHMQVLRAPLVRRYSVGAGQNSACGMLAATRR